MSPSVCRAAQIPNASQRSSRTTSDRRHALDTPWEPPRTDSPCGARLRHARPVHGHREDGATPPGQVPQSNSRLPQPHPLLGPGRTPQRGGTWRCEANVHLHPPLDSITLPSAFLMTSPGRRARISTKPPRPGASSEPEVLTRTRGAVRRSRPI
jgi:hypothetical protein